MRRFGAAILVAMAMVVAIHLTGPPPAEASIHEIIAALCRAGGDEVVPPGQNRGGASFLAALQATGFLTSIDFLETQVVFHFDPTVRASKFISAGRDLTIPNGWAEGVDIVLSPLVIPDPNFPAHAACHNLR